MSVGPGAVTVNLPRVCPCWGVRGGGGNVTIMVAYVSSYKGRLSLIRNNDRFVNNGRVAFSFHSHFPSKLFSAVVDGSVLSNIHQFALLPLPVQVGSQYK